MSETHISSRALPFNDDWTFEASHDALSGMMHGDYTPLQVRLPHDAMLDDRSPDAPSGASSGYHLTGSYRYEKEFEVPAEWAEKVILFDFEGVYRDARVFINGVLAAHHPYGYTGFQVCADPFLAFGVRNKIAVEVRTHLDSRWYSGAGIYRPVWLHLLEPVHIELDGVEVTTPDVDAKQASIHVATSIVNTTRHTKTVRLTTIIEDPVGDVADSDSSPVTLLPGERVRHLHRLYVPDPELWDLDSPHLYRAITVIDSGRSTTDELTTTFGIRTLQLDPNRSLRINGQAVNLRGGAVHHDNGPIGAVSIARAEERRVELLKAAGFNAIRFAHNPASKAMLDACDRVGMVVMNEAFDVWTRGKNEFDYSLSFPDHWQDDLRSMVITSRNHPSVIMYSIGNEVLEIVDAHGANIARRLADFVRTIDPNRFVTNALQLMWLRMEMAGAGAVETMNQMLSEEDEIPTNVSRARHAEVSSRIEEFSSSADVVGYNYADARYEVDLEHFPHEVVVGSETFPTRIATYWELVKRYPHVIGDFTWAAWDYLGEVGVGSVAYADGASDVVPEFMREFPFLAAEVGDLDITGFRRPVSYYREIVFGLRSEPFIAVRPPERFAQRIVHQSPWSLTDAVESWSWDGYEGSPVRVEVYADADEVRLLQDDIEVARGTVGGDRAFRVLFETTWRHGSLTAVAYRGGCETGRTTLISASGSIVLSVAADRDEIRADDTDLAYVTVELRDADGNLWVNDDRVITVTVDGAGELLGLGSADPRTEEPFRSETCKTFRGRALAVIRPLAAGPISVGVTSKDLEPTLISVRATEVASTA